MNAECEDGFGQAVDIEVDIGWIHRVRINRDGVVCGGQAINVEVVDTTSTVHEVHPITGVVDEEVSTGSTREFVVAKPTRHLVRAITAIEEVVARSTGK